MAVLAISYDWGVEPTIIRMTTDNTAAQMTTSGYWTSEDVTSSIEELNNGSFDVPEGSVFLINYSDGEGFFTLNTSTNAFVAETDPGSLSETLQDGDIFVGNAANVATGVTPSGDITLTNTGVFGIAAGAIVNADVNAAAAIAYSKLAALPSAQILVGSAGNVATAVAMSGDVAISNTGATTIQAGAVELGMLASGISPAYVVKFAGQPTTVGGAAAEAFAVAGALATDLAFVQMVDDGTNNVTIVDAVVTNDTLTVTFSGNPGNDCVFNYQLLRAAS